MEEEILEVREQIEAIASVDVTSAEQLNVMSEYLMEVSTVLKELTSTSKEEKKPFKVQMDTIDDKYKPLLNEWKTLDTLLRDKVVTFYNYRYAKRDELVKAMTTADESVREEIRERLETIIPEKVPGIGIKEKLVAEVVDNEEFVKFAIEKGAEDLLQPNMELLQELVESSAGGITIPGMAVRTQRSLVVSPSRVKKGESK